MPRICARRGAHIIQYYLSRLSLAQRDEGDAVRVCQRARLHARVIGVYGHGWWTGTGIISLDGEIWLPDWEGGRGDWFVRVARLARLARLLGWDTMLGFMR